MRTSKSVKNPKKQRKMLFNAPAHKRHKLMAAPLSPELLAQKGVKALPVHKGDSVRVTRGDHKGFEGKISRIDLKRYRLYIEGLTREKVDGSTVFVALHPSKVMIRNLNLDDKLRKAVLERKKPIIKKAAKDAKKTAAPKKVKEAKPAAEPETTTVSEKAAKVEEPIAEKKPAAKSKTSQAEGGT